MGDFFADLRSGVRMPQVVMNQGPLPGSGGLPAPLHDTADARINYNSSLLGNLSPYAYGEPGYLSSQTAYLNIPHKIQKIAPAVFLPEAKPGATDFFDLSHPVDDGDLAFVLRLDRNSLFCTGLKNGDMRRSGLGTAIDPLINLATVNYILSGVQLGIPATPERLTGGDLWTELLFNLDRVRFGKRMGFDGRNYATNPINLSDIMHIVRHCVRPFGITRGSERQGGQNEATVSPATWPVSFVVSVTIDGKESNVMNLWHHQDLSAGDDLVLCLKLMPLRPYTLNHYYKGIKRQSWDVPDGIQKYVWQLVPNVMNLDSADAEAAKLTSTRLNTLSQGLKTVRVRGGNFTVLGTTPWQDMGYWHIGRTQVMTAKYGVEEYWHNDLANSLRTNHLDITLQPYFQTIPRHRPNSGIGIPFDSFGAVPVVPGAGTQDSAAGIPSAWSASLRLECLPDYSDSDSGSGSDSDHGGDHGLGLGPAPAADTEDIGSLDFTDPLPTLAAPETTTAGKKRRVGAEKAEKAEKGGKAVIGGSLLKPDGSSAMTMVSML